MNVAMIGTGYVGLVSGACFAEFGVQVTCVDKDKERIARLNRGIVPIYEPGLETLVKENVERKRFSFTWDGAAAVGEADVVFIAVGTPSRRGDGHADLTFVYEAAREIGKNLRNYTVVVNKSTVPVGTARAVKRIVLEQNPKADFDVASNPEFLREGSALGDFMRPDRVVIGVESERAKSVLQELYRPLYITETPMVITTLETAELIKYASNAFLATKISFINEIANLCEAVGANVKDVAKGMGFDKRIGPKFLHAGPGYGGSCFPKDTKALIKTFHDSGLPARIVEAVVQVNDAQKSLMVKKIRSALGGSEFGKVIAVLGLTFKPETDDMREAPSLTIVPALLEGGATVRAADPKGVHEARKIFEGARGGGKSSGGLTFLDDPYDTAEGADALVIMTEWNEYRALDLEKLVSRMRGRVFVDLKGVYDPLKVRESGFEYVGVGLT
jgi:UDPglucose 6-dehydrogenase